MRPALRRTIHISMVLFALVVGRWDPLWVCMAALAAFMFNLFLLPRLSQGAIEKPGSQSFWRDPGLISYPFAVFILSLLFYEQQCYLVIGWGAMAFGDPAAQYAGHRWGTRRIPWNQDKTWAGMLAFWVAATMATWGMIYLLPETVWPLSLMWWQWGAMIAIIMGVAALVESVPGMINDNLSVPIATGMVAWAAMQSLDLKAGAFPPESGQAVAAITVFMILSWGSGKIDLPGTVVGGILAMLIFIGAGWAGLGCLLLLFVLGTLASVFRRKEKQALGVAQEAGGKRSVRHAISNGGVAAILGALTVIAPDWSEYCIAGMVASLATATSDTFSSEFGSYYGKRFISIITWKPGERGEDGLISLEGTLAGLGGAICIAAAYVLVAGQSGSWILLISLAAMVGNMVDSLLGATFQAWGLMTNDSVNFAATLSGAMGMVLMISAGG